MKSGFFSNNSFSHPQQPRIIITRVTADISLAKRSLLNNPSKRALMERANSRSSNSLAEIQAEIERIFEFSRSMQLVVLDCDTVGWERYKYINNNKKTMKCIQYTEMKNITGFADQPPQPAGQNLAGPHPRVHQDQLTQSAPEAGQNAGQEPDPKHERPNGMCQSLLSLIHSHLLTFTITGGRRKVGPMPAGEQSNFIIDFQIHFYILFFFLQDAFDVILDENQLEDACEHLADYLESYWRATHPPVRSPPRIKRGKFNNG
jgi:hypothetical protein